MSTDPKRCYIKRVEGVTAHPQTSNLFLYTMTVVATLPRDVMVGMLRKGETGNQILDILNVIVPDQIELTDEEVTAAD